MAYRERGTIQPDIPSIEDPEEAQEYIQQLLEKGERPIVTVPGQFEQELQNGLQPHSSWLTNERIIAGTIGREPYLPSGEEGERIKVRIRGDVARQVVPRFTGPDKKFHGVVAFLGPIPRESIEVVN